MSNISAIEKLSSPRLDTFRELIDQRGFSLIRLKGKTPVESRWQKWCSTQREFDDIGFQPGENAGIACGPASGSRRTISTERRNYSFVQKHKHEIR